MSCGIIILLTSIEVIRRKKFEFFFYTHFAFLGFAILACLHNKSFIPYTLAAAALYVLDRFDLQ